MSESDETKKSSSSFPNFSNTSEDTLKSHMIINLNSNMMIMAQHVGEMALSVREVAVKIKDVEARRKRDRIVFGFVTIVLVLAFGTSWNNIKSNEEQLENQNEQLALLREQLMILREATSPETQARNAEATQRAVSNIVCQSNDSLIAFAQANGLKPPPRHAECTGN